jgi:hypothetical protein
MRRFTPQDAIASSSVDPQKRDALVRAKERLDRIDLYPRQVSLRGVRILVVPWLFRLSWFRRFDGYALHQTILLREPGRLDDETLIAHELCHVWQMQHHPVRMPFSYLLAGYADNPYEREARRATAPRVLVFLHGTAIMHRSALGVPREERVRQVRDGEESVRRFADYVPTPGAVEAVRAWAAAGCTIGYLSSHREPDDVAADAAVLERHGFPNGEILHRATAQSYGDVAAAWRPDVLVEDDCESIGGEANLAYPQLPADVRARTRSCVVAEFEGLAAGDLHLH